MKMNITSYINDQLQLAIAAYLAGGGAVRICDPNEAAAVIAKSKANFVNDDDRKNWWWEIFKAPIRRVGIAPERPYFADYLEICAECWLIVDDDSSELTVIESDVRGAEYILGQLPPIEFYLVGSKFDWLLAENHHGKIWLL
jgi:hypothetical protein